MSAFWLVLHGATLPMMLQTSGNVLRRSAKNFSSDGSSDKIIDGIHHE